MADDEADDDDDLGIDSPAPSQSTPSKSKLAPEQLQAPDGKLPWPTDSDLNIRLRKAVTYYQRIHKKHMNKLEQKQKKLEKRARFEDILRERERLKLDTYQK